MKRVITFFILVLINIATYSQSRRSNILYDEAMSLYKSNVFSEALVKFEECVKLDKEEMDSTNSRIHYSSGAVAACYYRLGLTDKLDSLDQYYIHDDPIDRNLTIKIDSLYDKAVEHANKKEFDRALKCSQEAYTTAESFFGKNSPMCLNPLMMISVSEFMTGKHEHAKNDFVKTYNAFLQHTKKNNPLFWDLGGSIFNACLMSNDMLLALEWAKKQLEFSLKYQSEDTEKRKIASNMLLYVLTQMGRVAEYDQITNDISNTYKTPIIENDIELKIAQAQALLSNNQKNEAEEILTNIEVATKSKFGERSLGYAFFLKLYGDAVSDNILQMRKYEQSLDILESYKDQNVEGYIVVGTQLIQSYITNNEIKKCENICRTLKGFISTRSQELSDTLMSVIALGETMVLAINGQFKQAAENIKESAFFWRDSKFSNTYYLLTGFLYSAAEEYALGKQNIKKGFELLDELLEDSTEIRHWKSLTHMGGSMIDAMDKLNLNIESDSAKYSINYIKSEFYHVQLKAYERLDEFGMNGMDSIGGEAFMTTLRNFALVTCDKSWRGDRIYGIKIMQHYIDLLEKKFGRDSYERFRAWELMLAYGYDKENKMPEELYNQYMQEVVAWDTTIRHEFDGYSYRIRDNFEDKKWTALRELTENEIKWREDRGWWKKLASTYEEVGKLDSAVVYYEKCFVQELEYIKRKSRKERKESLIRLYDDRYLSYKGSCNWILDIVLKNNDIETATNKLEFMLQLGDNILSEEQKFKFWIDNIYRIYRKSDGEYLIDYLNSYIDKYGGNPLNTIRNYRLQAMILDCLDRKQEAYNTMAKSLNLAKSSKLKKKKNIILDYKCNLLYYEYKYLNPDKNKSLQILLELHDLLYPHRNTEWINSFAYICYKLAVYYSIYEDDYDKAIYYGNECHSIPFDMHNVRDTSQDGTDWAGPFNYPCEFLTHDYVYNNIIEWHLKNREDSYFSTYFQQEKNSILRYSRRAENYLHSYESFVTSMSSLALLINTPEASKYAYDAALLGKGIRLQSQNAVKSVILNGDNETLKDLYYQWMKVNEEMAKYKEGIPDSLQRKNKLLEEKLNKASSIFGDFTNQLNISWKDIQSKLDENEVAIEFTSSKHNETLCAVFVTKYREPQMLRLCSEYYLKRIENRWYSSCELNDSIWQPILSTLDKNVNKIYFSPYGILNSIAIESVHDNTGVISDKYDMVRLSSTREIVKNTQPVTICKALLLGDFDYNLSDEKTNNADSIWNSFRNVNVQGNLRDMVNRGAIHNIPMLPGSVEEMSNISSCLSSANISVCTVRGKEGSEDKVRAHMSQGYSIIHFATHGFYEETNNNENLSNSGLMLTGALHGLTSEEYSDTDGILTSQEISTIDLGGLDMIVLSACETALGGVNSDGVFGLQRGFKKAGANSILMSLWKVDDAATCKLMTEFYSNWIGKKMTKHDALEAAKKNVRETKGWEDPKYWAAFILLDGLD